MFGVKQRVEMWELFSEATLDYEFKNQNLALFLPKKGSL